MTTFGSVPYNIDINQPGASQQPRFSITNPTPYQDGLVVDIILNEKHKEYLPDGSNVGMIKVRFIPGDRLVDTEKLNWVAPLETSIREYPLKNELVLVFYSLGRLFYTRRINATNKLTESSWPGLEQRFSAPVTGQQKSDAAQLAAKGASPYRPWGMKEEYTLGSEFAENPEVRMVRPSEGDLIIQGRYGHSVRFGSSLFSNPTTTTPQPNLLLTVGQSTDREMSTVGKGVYSLVYEDINKDKSSIWMMTNEKVALRPATMGSIAHLRSAEISDSTKYVGAQIFINSDRLILNSRAREISLFSKAEINLSAVQSITVDSANSVMMTAERDITMTAPEQIILTGRTISINGAENIVQQASRTHTISAKKIFIGSGDADQPLVLGGELAKWLQEFIDTLLRPEFQPLAFSAVGPVTLNPVIVTKLIDLSVKLGLPASPQSAIFNSTSNFTSKDNLGGSSFGGFGGGGSGGQF